MKNILLILTNTRMSDESINTAIQTVKDKNTKLIILFVIDEERSAQSVITKLIDEGWMGSKVSEDLYRSIENEFKSCCRTKIEEIEQRTNNEGIECKTIIKKGDFVEEVLKTIEEENVDMSIITRRKRSNLSRLIFGSAVKDIQTMCKCAVKIIDE